MIKKTLQRERIMKYDAEEKELLDALEKGDIEHVSFDNDQIKKMAADTLDYLNQKKQITTI